MGDDQLVDFIRGRHAALLRRAFLLTGDAGLAEDLVQESLARLWLSSSRRPVDNPEAFVRKVMVNSSVSSWRKKRFVETTPSAGDVETVLAADGIADADTHDLIWGALRRLPPRQRAILVLRYYEDLTEAEICYTLSISPGTVRSQTYKARQTLRQIISAEEGASL